MSRLGPSVDGSLSTLAVVAAGVVVLSFVALQSGGATQTGLPGVGVVEAGGSGNGTSSGNGTGTGTNNGPGTVGSGPKGSGPAVTVDKKGDVKVTTPKGIECRAGANGGKTDRGVTATEIKLGATVVQTGIGTSFLGPVVTGMNAVKNKVNREGGICGRKVTLKLKDDGWDAQRGYTYIRNLVEGEKVFALAVNPSSEGLRIASNEGYFVKTQTPVLGTDGMLNSQYVDPWVWPVAASTVSTMHIMAKDAYDRLDARNFSIVFDSQYHFGVEGAFAYNAAVKRLTGKDIPGYFDPGSGGGCSGRFCAINAGRSSYSTENRAFNSACFGGDDKCDFLALLLEPSEALTFVRDGFGQTFTAGMGLAQTLFSEQFAAACGSTCNGATVWTGYLPPVGGLASKPAVAEYVNDVRGVKRDIDIYNQFLEGGYLGMRYTIDVLKKVGPFLTRPAVLAVADAMPYDVGLSTPLKWSRGNHYANTAMQPFLIQFQNGFNGFRSPGIGWVKDPWVGLDAPKE
ncbi:MAG TPA: ABC transporter substrate-binding protein [Frankiaceae bacterium]|jgi:ABC-type branched-subunit amino acid transport system substrate-binding protein|nr:ABC transporter substrate-binding protein [Frankiaceae bacterium]